VPRGSIVRVVSIGVVLGLAATAVAYFVPWLPDRASDQAYEIDFVFWFATAICIVIFALVASISVYSVWKFRAKPDDDSDGPPIHGHTGLEIAWTVVPFILVTALAVVSTVALARNDELPSGFMPVEVTAQQFVWHFKYPENGGVTTGTLRLPLKVPVELRMTAKDVIHSFYVPEFRQKQDVLPGETTTLIVTPTKLGTFTLECTELCGIGHALMRTRVIVMRRPAFDTWLQRQQGSST
jgi:cytochrome c oxidase subunit 2